MTKQLNKLSENEIKQKLKKLSANWKMQKQKLSLNLKLESFMEVIDLTKQIANIAESESHHPNLKIHSYNRLDIEIYTHEIDGISNKDILLAQKIDELIS